MQTSFCFGIVVAAAMSFASPARADEAASKAFIAKAIEGNFAEVAMGKLAQKKGQSDGVKRFGKMLEQDHSAANQKAVDAAKSLGVTAPSGPSQKQKLDYEMMAKETGGTFDSGFVTHMIEDHKDDIGAYQTEAKSGNDAAVQYANDTLPTLNKHLETAKSLDKSK